MQQSNNSDVLGSLKKQRCISLHTAALGEEGMCACVREHKSTTADGNGVRQPSRGLRQCATELNKSIQFLYALQGHR